MEHEVIAGCLRVQVLSDAIVRVEYAEDGKFFDGNSLFIPARKEFTGCNNVIACSKKTGTSVFFSGYELVLPSDLHSLHGVVLLREGREVYSFGGEKNTGELPPLDKTPEVFAVADTPRISLPEGGYSAAREGEFTVEESAQDVYLLLCGGDYRKLRALYVQLTGRCALVRLSTLGVWNSKYFKYDEESARQVIFDYEKYDIPLDNMVLDTDWRAASDRGIGYDVDTRLFPDMKRFMDFAHSRGVQIMFNDHPEPLDGADSVFSPEEIAFREKKLQSLMELGLDMWWYDRNWSAKLRSPVAGVKPETLGMYLFSEITDHFYREKSGGAHPSRRPDIMANVNEVTNGTYIGIRDSASHRYSIQWTGDIASDSYALAQEVDTLLRASESCIPYVNADCGGHIGNPDREMYLHWIGFGTFSPVLRPHCTNIVARFREPWLYDEETLAVVRAYFKLRYRLLPVFYAAAYASYLTGEPICKRLGWNYSDDGEALACRTQFMLGENILVAPVFGALPMPVKAENYLSSVEATFFAGRSPKGDPLARTHYKTLALSLDHASPLEPVPVYDFSARFETDVCFAEDTKLFVRLDDGATVYVDNKCVFTDDTLHSAQLFPLGTVSGGEKHHIVIEYFQAGGEACCELLSCPAREPGKQVYLPEGTWLDAFTGQVCRGGWQRKEPSFGETPIFIRMGALIPLARDAKNTKEQTWDKLTFDFYPARAASDEGLLYEDDGETLAYQDGAYRTTAYRAYFDEQERAYVLEFDRACGSFKGERACARREVTVRVHCLGERFGHAALNGKWLAFERIGKNPSAFPLAAEGGARDGDVIIASFMENAENAYQIKLYLAERK